MAQYTKNQIASPIVFLMISSVDHITPALGLTVTATLSKNGSAFAAAIGAVSEIGVGWYKLVPNIADFNTVGPLILHATAPNADPTDAENEIVSGVVTLGSTQTFDLIGNVRGSVGSVLAPVICANKPKGC